jgi:hypothetical protein
MDKLTRQLAVSLADVYHAELSPVHNQLREELLGRLSVTGAELDNAKELARQRSENHDMLQAFVGELPEAHRDVIVSDSTNFSYRVDTHDTVAALDRVHGLQRSLLWIKQSNHSKYGRRYKGAPHPYYIMGAAKDPESGRAALLLYRAHPSPYSMSEPEKQALIFRSRLSKINRILSRTTDYELGATPEELVNLYDEASGQMRISGTSKGSLLATTLYVPAISPAISDSTVFWARRGELQPVPFGVTDEELAKFNVLDVANKLAMRFSQLDAWKTVLAYQPQQPQRLLSESSD